MKANELGRLEEEGRIGATSCSVGPIVAFVEWDWISHSCIALLSSGVKKRLVYDGPFDRLQVWFMHDSDRFNAVANIMQVAGLLDKIDKVLLLPITDHAGTIAGSVKRKAREGRRRWCVGLCRNQYLIY